MIRATVIAAIVLAFATVSAAQPEPGQGGRYMIEFDRLAPGAPGLVRAAGGSPVHEFPEFNVIAARLPAAAVEALRNHPRVRSIVEDVPRYPFSTGETKPYGISMVQADQVAPGANLGDMKVCVIDSGYFVGHGDLPPQDLVKGTNNGGTGLWSQDRCGHGTHVAGTIAAVGGNGTGVVGVVPNGGLPMHIVKVFGDTCAWTYSSDLINALNTCRSNGARIVNMSLGGGKAIGPWEERAFNDAYNAGVLLVAAAGNAGTTALSYPASYNSVISVAAIDDKKVVADFSQKNSQVELAAPGVGVLSTVPYIETNTLAVSGGPTFSGAHISAAARTGGATGELVNGGRCTSVGSWSGKVVLCERGDVSFKAKVDNVAAGGGRAAVIYNNEPGGFLGTCDGGSGTTCSLPAIGVSQADGQAAVAHHLGKSGTVVSTIQQDASGYEAWNGTSMATPHVAGAAALVWSQNTNWTNAQIRQALQATAEDLGPAGRDTSYGFGLVRAKAALCALDVAFCGSAPPPNAPPQASFTFTASGLSVSFTDTSVDPDGSIAFRNWTFGDGGSSTAQHPTHTYAAGGTYTVQLTVTDNGGATASSSQSVTVTPPSSGGIILLARGYKVQGNQKVDLEWSGATSSSVDVFRGAAKVATVPNNGSYTDHIDRKGGGSYTYRVCHAGTTTCSSTVTVSF